MTVYETSCFILCKTFVNFDVINSSYCIDNNFISTILSSLRLVDTWDATRKFYNLECYLDKCEMNNAVVTRRGMSRGNSIL